MKTQKLSKNIILFTFSNRKEITLAFFRMQEFYESPNTALLNKKFSVWDFLNESMSKNGEIGYFSYWCGFNIPSEVLSNWWKLHVHDLTHAEIQIFDALYAQEIDFHEPFYVIGALEKDKAVIKHEIAHALYYTDLDYECEMNESLLQLKIHQLKIYKKMKKELLKMGYNDSVIDDEVQAYLSSESPKYIQEEFGIDIKNVPEIKQMRKVLSKYNTFNLNA